MSGDDGVHLHKVDTMEQNIPELRVHEPRKDGRRKFDEQSKCTLIEACLKPGVSVARMAQTYGVNSNLLRKWITRYLMEREQAWQEASQQRQAVATQIPDAGRPWWCVYRRPSPASK